MATFSTNQVRQLYVANASGAVAEGAALGTIEVKADNAKTHLYFKHMGAGGVVRSDLIDIKNISYAKATDAANLAVDMKKVKLALSADVNSGAPIAGQEYLLRIAFRQYIGLSEEDQYFKYGVVQAYTGMTAEQFYTVLKSSLEKNFSREEKGLLSFSLEQTAASATLTDNSGVKVTAIQGGTIGNSIKFAISSVAADDDAVTVSTTAGVTTVSVALKAASATGAGLKAAIAASAAAKALVSVDVADVTVIVAEDPAVALTAGATTGLIIEELEQPWYLGTMQQERVAFEVQPTTVMVDDFERVWGEVTELDSTTSVKNGKTVADLEYFCMGERGDQYRMMGWPNVVYTKYLVDPSKEYNVVDIQYAYQGDAEDIQKSPKYITLLIPKVGVNDAAGNALANVIIGAINTAAGTTINTLNVS